MPKVMCNQDMCRYWTEEGCCAEELSLFFEYRYEGECETYENYANEPAYREHFWLRLHDVDGTEVKIPLCGKRIEYRGRIFYTRDRLRKDGRYEVVDGVTGIAIGLYRDLEERFQDLLDFEKRVRKLEDVLVQKSPWTNWGQVTELDPFEAV